ncbi:hypothetical protein TIFTF001_027059 [Ficus carica]|uniref:Uncharacterized protein n=1 Tax=Ficus carica TaxID=3494 RepID=A0AA88IZN3_FICCA|nr:hypothetical protein TIFTF001_027059 [Ficus carica]
MKVIKGDTKDNVELQTLGDNRWDHDDLLEIDHSKELIHHEEKEFTLKDIVDGLTEPEKQLLINPIGSHKAWRRNLWAYCRQANSWFDRKGSIEEDIDRTQRLFHINYEDLGMFGGELACFAVEEGLLKLDEKYLRQKVEDVGGYMVPKTLAPILKTSLRKYGDLSGYESLTPAMKSVTSTLLCIVIDKMCKIKVEDLTWDDLRHSCCYLNGIKEITGFEIDMYLSSLKGVIMEAFLGMVADRCKNDIKEKLDRKIATLEAELARCKENREKINKHPFKRSAHMEHCATQASEWKHKKLGDAWF